MKITSPRNTYSPNKRIPTHKTHTLSLFLSLSLSEIKSQPNLENLRGQTHKQNTHTKKTQNTDAAVTSKQNVVQPGLFVLTRVTISRGWVIRDAQSDWICGEEGGGTENSTKDTRQTTHHFMNFPNIKNALNDIQGQFFITLGIEPRTETLPVHQIQQYFWVCVKDYVAFWESKSDSIPEIPKFIWN